MSFIAMRHLGWMPILLALSMSTAAAAQQCRLARYPAIPSPCSAGGPRFLPRSTASRPGSSWSDSWVAPLLRTRSLIGLRQGNLQAAIADDDAAIKLRPHGAYALYARGLAELREGSKADGQADLAAAEKLDGDVAGRFARMGLTP